MVSLILILICPLACAEFTRFNRQPALNNKQIVDDTSVVMTTVSLDQCARECHDNSSCLSFIHNQDGGRCQTMSRLHLNSEDSVVEYSNKIFTKNIDDAVCPIPEVIENGRVLYTDGLVEGSVAEFVCDDYYFPTIETGVCDISGTWQGLDNACNYHQVPLIIGANGKLFPGSCFTIIATPIHDTFFNIILYEHPPESHVPLVLSPRFSYDGDVNTHVMNTRYDNVWGTQERYSGFWPFVVNREFNLTICLEDTLFRIIVDDVDITTFAYRQLQPDIETLAIEYDLIVRSVRFNI